MREFEMDTNVVESIKHWFKLGLPPGSFSSYLIKDDCAQAFMHAHHLLTVKQVRDMWDWTQLYLPIEAKDLDNWKGYDNMTLEEKRKIKLTSMIEDEIWGEIN